MALSLAARAFLQTTLGSQSSANNSNNKNSKRHRRIKGSPPPSTSKLPPRRKPSVAEVQRAVGITEDPLAISNSNSSPSPTSFLDLMSSTPIGQIESPAERKIREVAEWVVDKTESKVLAGQKFFLVMCLKILPLWLFLLLVASGAIKLPFDLPFMDDLIS